MRRSKKIDKEKEENICKRKINLRHNREGNGGKISWRRKYCCGQVDRQTLKALKEVLGDLKSALVINIGQFDLGSLGQIALGTVLPLA